MRSSRIEPDSRTMTMASMALVGVLAVASFTLSFQGLIQAAEWAGIAPQLRWLVPIVVDSTILVYAVAASVQRARGESTLLSWCAVGFFTAVSVAANAAHVLAPGGVPVPISGTVIFGAFLAAIMPVSLFFATETTVQLAVAPPVGSVSQRRRRALARLVQERGGPENVDQFGALPGPAAGHRGPATGPVRGPLVDHPSGPPRTKADVKPGRILELAEQKLSQRAIAQQLGTSKSTVARVLAEHADGSRESSTKVAALS
ncbi:DUF2637 domain-containing protein [Pseudarthrobacter scleromae]|uniref:DUF2637 domain-containing protein n=1 Tax=Pseudarthrobacter scleromae TaxID=158897 RepID=UPI00363067D1